MFRGYESRLLIDLVMDHLKPRNISQVNSFHRQWQMGIRDYALGYYPLFEVFKCLSRVLEPPVLIGCIAWLFGYCFAAIQRRERMISRDLLEHLRSEQKRRLRFTNPAQPDKQ